MTDWLDDERALADELADKHDLGALRARVLEGEQDAVLIEFPKPQTARRLITYLAVAAALALVGVSGWSMLAEETSQPNVATVDPALTQPPNNLGAKSIAPTLPPPPPSPPARDGVERAQLTLNTTPWSRVSIDGEPVGNTPIFRAQVSPGEHELTFENPVEGLKLVERVTLKAGEIQRRSYRLTARDGLIALAPKTKAKSRPMAKPAARAMTPDIRRLSRSDVLGGIKAGKAKFTACGAKHGRTGKVIKLEFRINKRGNARGVKILTTSLADEPVADCVIDVVKGLRFKANDGETPPVRIPLKL